MDKPIVDYDTDGDELEVLLTDESYYGDWRGPQLTLYRRQGTDEIVGFVVSGIRRLVDG